MPERCCFDDWARHDARRARRRRRPDGVTRALLAALERVGLRGRTVLDVGCGAGELALACLHRGARRATGTDLSGAAVDEASALARERGVADRTRFAVADAAHADLEQHDVVVLNRVLCCFPDAVGLATHTAAVADHVYAFVVPRSAGPAGVVAKAMIGAGNLAFRLNRRRFGDYRAHVHEVDVIDRELRAAGLTRVHDESVHYLWHLAVYERAG